MPKSKPKSTRNPAIDVDRIIMFVGDYPLTANDLGEILDESIVTAMQKIIDSGLVPSIPVGSPWYEHMNADGFEIIRKKDDNALVKALQDERDVAEQELLATYSQEAREKVIDCQRRIKMARKLVAD